MKNIRYQLLDRAKKMENEEKGLVETISKLKNLINFIEDESLRRLVSKDKINMMSTEIDMPYLTCGHDLPVCLSGIKKELDKVRIKLATFRGE